MFNLLAFQQPIVACTDLFRTFADHWTVEKQNWVSPYSPSSFCRWEKGWGPVGLLSKYATELIGYYFSTPLFCKVHYSFEPNQAAVYRVALWTGWSWSTNTTTRACYITLGSAVLPLWHRLAAEENQLSHHNCFFIPSHPSASFIPQHSSLLTDFLLWSPSSTVFKIQLKMLVDLRSLLITNVSFFLIWHCCTCIPQDIEKIFTFLTCRHADYCRDKERERNIYTDGGREADSTCLLP